MENTDYFNLGEWLLNKTIEMVAQISVYQQIPFDKNKAVEYLMMNGTTRLKDIVTDVRKEQEESKESFLFNSPGWQKKIFDTNLTHAILMFAKDILEYSKSDSSVIIN